VLLEIFDAVGGDTNFQKKTLPFKSIVMKNEFLVANQFIINVRKTKYMFLSKPDTVIEQNSKLYCNQSIFERVSVFKYIGIYLQQTLTRELLQLKVAVLST